MVPLRGPLTCLMIRVVLLAIDGSPRAQFRQSSRPRPHRPINRAGSNSNGVSGDQRDSTISATRRRTCRFERVEQAPLGALLLSSRARFVVVRIRQPPPSGSACSIVGLGKHHIARAAAPGGEQQCRRQDLRDDWSSSNRRAVRRVSRGWCATTSWARLLHCAASHPQAQSGKLSRASGDVQRSEREEY